MVNCADIVELGFVESLALQGNQAHRQAGSVELEHHRRQGSRRQPLQVRQREVGNLGYVGVGVGAGLKVDLDDADAQQRTRFQVVDAARQREKAFQGIGDIGLDVLRRHAGVERRHHDLRQVDRGEKIHRHARQAGDSDHQEGQADHDDEVWISNGES